MKKLLIVLSFIPMVGMGQVVKSIDSFIVLDGDIGWYRPYFCKMDATLDGYVFSKSCFGDNSVDINFYNGEVMSYDITINDTFEGVVGRIEGIYGEPIINKNKFKEWVGNDVRLIIGEMGNNEIVFMVVNNRVYEDGVKHLRGTIGDKLNKLECKTE